MDGQTVNQQRKTSEADMGWLAGFWDGEGTISLRLNRSHPRTKSGLITPYAQVSNTSEAALERTGTILTALSVGHHIQSLRLYPRPGVLSRLPQWRLVVAGYKRVDAFLAQVYPYLVVKQPAAEVVRDFIQLRMGKSAREPYAPEEWLLLAKSRTQSTKNGSALPINGHSLESPTDYTRDGLDHSPMV